MELDTEMDEIPPVDARTRHLYEKDFARGLRLYDTHRYHEAFGVFVQVAQAWADRPEYPPTTDWLRDLRLYLFKTCIMTRVDRSKERQALLPESIFQLEGFVLNDWSSQRRWAARIGIWFGRPGLKAFDFFERIAMA